jgi:tetratricopeptide (TPR) repeat protein
MRFLRWALVAGVVFAATAARADDSAPRRALELHDEARALYAKGRYTEAIDKLRLAVELDPDAKVLYYNLGLIEEKLGHVDSALAYFRRCLELEQSDEERVALARIVKRLEGAKKYVDWDEASLPPIIIRRGSEVAGDGGGEAPLLPWVYAAGGTAAVAAILSVGLAAGASSVDPGDEPSTRADTSVEQLEEDARAAHGLAIGADVTLGIAAGALATTLVLALIAAHHTPTRSESGLFVEPSGRWGWRF